MPQNNRDPLGLTLPPPDHSHRVNIVPGHTPNNADIWDKGRQAWKFCFVAYRYNIFGDYYKDIAKMLGDTSPGPIGLKRHRIRLVLHKGEYAYRYVKFSQEFVDRWVDIAKLHLTAIHNGDEAYAVSLLPI